jgi:glycosyltransferase involved in cell wall biosynthesis
MNSKVIVSIILPTYNSLDKLSKALSCLNELDYPRDNFEIIVVDDGSNDGTQEYVKEFMSQVKLNSTYVYQPNKGPAAARNNGIRRASGKYLLLIDSDCYVDRNILTHYLRHFPDDCLGGVGGNVLPESLNVITEYLDHQGIWRPGVVNGEIAYLVTANAFFLKEAVESAGYFDEEFRQPGGEDPELCCRIRQRGYHLKYDEQANVVHAHRTTFLKFMKTFFVYGKGRGLLAMKCPNEYLWKMPFLRIVFGIDSIAAFLFNYIRKVNLLKAITFFTLDYLRMFAYYCGFKVTFNAKKRTRTYIM